MLTNISQIQNYVIGFCCIQGKEREEIYRFWQARFSKRNSFLIDVDDNDDAETILQNFIHVLEEQRITALGNMPCILTVFLDATEEYPPERLEMLASLKNKISMLQIGANISVALQFAFMGSIHLMSTDIQKENVRRISESNMSQSSANQHRLCVVAKPTLGRESGWNWKAVIVFLDILRRYNQPMDCMPDTGDGNTNNDVGFLRYGEFDRSERERVEQRREQIEQRIGDKGRDRFQSELGNWFSVLKEEIIRSFPIEGKYQPQHPDMVLPPKKFLSNPAKKAAKGKYPPYENARKATESALVETGERLKAEILNRFQALCDNAATELQELMDKAVVGIGLKKDRAVFRNLLINSGNRTSMPFLYPRLMYSDNGKVEEITEYLNSVRDAAIQAGQNNLREALCKAYDSISEEQFNEEEQRLRDELDEVMRTLGNAVDARTFCNNTVFGGKNMTEDFVVIAPNGEGGRRRFILVRGEDQVRTLNEAVNNQEPWDVKLCEISETTGGIVTLDTAPIKAVEISFYDYDDNVLKQLLPGVDT